MSIKEYLRSEVRSREERLSNDSELFQSLISEEEGATDPIELHMALSCYRQAVELSYVIRIYNENFGDDVFIRELQPRTERLLDENENSLRNILDLLLDSD